MGLRGDYCYGKRMTAVDIARASSESACEVRAITILGATGSIGTSTLDLIKRAPERYRVESISARRNAAALGKSPERPARAMPWSRTQPPMATSKTRFPDLALRRRRAKGIGRSCATPG
jgi:hypothetical protein